MLGLGAEKAKCLLLLVGAQIEIGQFLGVGFEGAGMRAVFEGACLEGDECRLLVAVEELENSFFQFDSGLGVCGIQRHAGFRGGAQLGECFLDGLGLGVVESEEFDEPHPFPAIG